MFDKNPSPSQDIVETATAAGRFNTLLSALALSGLAKTLKGSGPFTVFAPTDEAFSRLDGATWDAMLEDKAKLAALVAYHVVAGRYTASDVAQISSAPSVQGQSLRFSTTPGVRVNKAHVLEADIFGRNGVIHAIDEVLLPD